MIHNLKTEAFVNGIRDPYMKLAVSSIQKRTFAETVAFTLSQETALAISTSTQSAKNESRGGRRMLINLKRC